MASRCLKSIVLTLCFILITLGIMIPYVTFYMFKNVYKAAECQITNCTYLETKCLKSNVRGVSSEGVCYMAVVGLYYKGVNRNSDIIFNSARSAAEYCDALLKKGSSRCYYETNDIESSLSIDKWDFYGKPIFITIGLILLWLVLLLLIVTIINNYC